jgi:hypothetical protein
MIFDSSQAAYRDVITINTILYHLSIIFETSHNIAQNCKVCEMSWNEFYDDILIA